MLRRADGALGYPLACVVDEAAQQITEVVRGADLIGSSFRQLWLQRLMGLEPPAYRHLPVLAGADGRKLSKQNHAAPVDTRHAPANLLECLDLLGQQPPAELRQAPAPEILAWAITHWNPETVPVGASACGRQAGANEYRRAQRWCSATKHLACYRVAAKSSA